MPVSCNIDDVWEVSFSITEIDPRDECSADFGLVLFNFNTEKKNSILVM